MGGARSMEEGAKVPTSPKGRRCDCGTILSIYNDTDLCGACTVARPASKREAPRMRGRKVEVVK